VREGQHEAQQRERVRPPERAHGDRQHHQRRADEEEEVEGGGLDPVARGRIQGRGAEREGVGARAHGEAAGSGLRLGKRPRGVNGPRGAGCAGILWKTKAHAEHAARALKFTSKDLLRFGIVDEIIPEPLGGAHRDHRQMAATLKASLARQLKALGGIRAPELLNRRYEKFRRIGMFEEGALATAQ